MIENIISIGEICNYYGGLSVKEYNNYYWSIENYSGHSWEEIPDYLYEALIKFENERNKS